MSAVVLKTENLSYIYSKGTSYEVRALEDVCVEIEKGELVGIIGHTGSGKSTLIQQFNGILAPTTGTVLFEGKDIWADKKKIRDIRFRVGVCFQYPEYQLFEETVEKDIAFGPKNMKMSDEEIEKVVRKVISFVGLDESYLEKSPFDLSGGEKRRVAIAGIMAMEPDILVLDEPCAGLDPLGRETVLEMIRDYRLETGRTVVLVSHSMEDIAKVSDRILVLKKGKVAFFDEVNAVFSHAEELREMGLNIPQITQLFIALRENGIDCRTDIYTLPEAEKELCRLLSGGNHA